MFNSLISLFEKKHESGFQKKLAARCTSKMIVEEYIAPLIEDNKADSIQSLKIMFLNQSLYVNELERKLKLLDG
jgi:hypothetical protein